MKSLYQYFHETSMQSISVPLIHLDTKGRLTAGNSIIMITSTRRLTVSCIKDHSYQPNNPIPPDLLPLSDTYSESSTSNPLM